MNWSHCASAFMIFLLLHDFYLWKELETRAGTQQLMGKLTKTKKKIRVYNHTLGLIALGQTLILALV